MSGPEGSGDYPSLDGAMEAIRTSWESEQQLSQAHQDGDITLGEYREQNREITQARAYAEKAARGLGATEVDLWGVTLESKEDESGRQLLFDVLQFEGHPEMGSDEFGQLADQFGLDTLTEERSQEMEQQSQQWIEEERREAGLQE
ncbi:hypothetical protein IH980_00065 [Patescibacteria group bacterium]|nr:hypothetical protein [Patescibacteria group bacterium]